MYLLTTSNLPPSYGVPSGPGNVPLRWNGESSMSSIWIFDALSFLQSLPVAGEEINEIAKRQDFTCDFFVYSSKTGIHDIVTKTCPAGFRGTSTYES